MRYWASLAILAAAFAANASYADNATPSPRQPPPQSSVQSGVEPSTTASLTPATATQRRAPPADYVIGPLDKLRVDVFDVPDLSRAVQVDDSGYVVFPLIGQIHATGRTADQLAQDIAAALRAKYMKNPLVTVSVEDAVSQKITVDGSVTQPGVYQIGPGTTLLQAVAMAKGPDQVADVHHVTIVREENGKRLATDYDLDDVREGKVVDPAIQAGDTIVVDVSGSRKFVRDFGSVLSILGWLHP